jgi:hypothetical protein
MNNKFSFRATDPEVISLLNNKKETNEMSAYINNALIFYSLNHQKLNDIETAIFEIKQMLEKGEFVIGTQVNDNIKKEVKTSAVDDVLINSIDLF